jgi:hypothetical protein
MDILEIIKEELLFERKKKKKKKKVKRDACYYKVKSRYDVWPSAYASGALVKCRKVGVDNWGESKKESEEIKIHNLILERKLTSKPSSETSLRDWFGRKGAKGSTGGWVDCNAPDGDGGYKSCGRKDGEERSKYPACRPTPSACKEYKSTKGKSWGKKAKKESISEGLQYHIENKIPIRENIYRFGSDSYLDLLKEVRSLYFKGKLKLNRLDEEYVMSDIGTKDFYNGEEIWLDIPISSENLNEAKHNGREVSVNSPGKSGGKNYVYVKGCLKDKSKVKKITYGSSMPDKLRDPDRRKAFSARHGCQGLTLKDKCTRRYWACRKPKDFTDINSWW